MMATRWLPFEICQNRLTIKNNLAPLERGKNKSLTGVIQQDDDLWRIFFILYSLSSVNTKLTYNYNTCHHKRSYHNDNSGPSTLQTSSKYIQWCEYAEVEKSFCLLFRPPRFHLATAGNLEHCQLSPTSMVWHCDEYLTHAISTIRNLK